MSKNKTIQLSVTLLGQQYKIACPEQAQAQLLQAAQLLDHKMREIQNSKQSVDTNRIAVVAALNLAHSYLQTRAQAEAPLMQAITQLNDKIDQALGTDVETAE